MYFLSEDDQLSKTYYDICEKSVTAIKKKLIVGLATIKMFLKTKLWSYGDETTDFNDREMPMVDCNHASLALITIDCALKNDEHYYLQVFIKECKYIDKEKIDIYIYIYIYILIEFLILKRNNFKVNYVM